MTKPLPRFVIAKTLRSGATGFYFNIPTFYRRLAARFRTSRSVMTTRSLAVLTATVGALRRSMNYSTSGTTTGSVKPSGPASCSGTALLTGYFGSTELARRISTKWHRVRGRLRAHNACCRRPPYQKGRPDRQPFRSIDHAARRRQALSEDHSRQKGPSTTTRRESRCVVSQGLEGGAPAFPDDFDNLVPNPWDGVTRRTRTKKRNRRHPGAGLCVRMGMH